LSLEKNKITNKDNLHFVAPADRIDLLARIAF